MPTSTPKTPRVLVLDVGGSHVKLLATGRKRRARFRSDRRMTPTEFVRRAKERARGWKYDVVSIGIPAPVVHGRLVVEPVNLGDGWVGFDFERAFGRPVRLANDAVMQALGSYRGGRMLYLGLGTGLGSAMVVDGKVEPFEFGHFPSRKGKTYGEDLRQRALKRRGKKKWRRSVLEVVERFRAALEPDYVVLGGGNAKKVKRLPARTVRGSNRFAFAGGLVLWRPGAEDGTPSAPARYSPRSAARLRRNDPLGSPRSAAPPPTGSHAAASERVGRRPETVEVEA